MCSAVAAQCTPALTKQRSKHASPASNANHAFAKLFEQRSHHLHRGNNDSHDSNPVCPPHISALDEREPSASRPLPPFAPSTAQHQLNSLDPHSLYGKKRRYGSQEFYT